jgi:DNA replication protein DnaC
MITNQAETEQQMDTKTDGVTPSTLRRMIDYNRQEERQRYVRDYQERSKLGPEDLARHLNRRCPYCGAYLVPTQIPDEWRGEGHFLTVWPDSHGCQAELTALSRQAVREAQDEVEAWNKAYLKRLKDAGLVGLPGKATFDSFEPRKDWAEAMEVRDRVMAYAQAIAAGEKDRPFLILYGNFGNGKSHLAAAAVRYFVDLDWTNCYFRVWPNYLARIRATYKRRRDEEEEADDHETEADIVAELQTGQVVTIDDLDKRRPTDFVRDTLFEVVNHRYNEGLPTIMTFNYGPEDMDPKAPARAMLEAYLSRAVLDRILDQKTAFDIIEFTGPSYRSGLDWGTR